jgi:hypothetical protein
MPRIEVMNIKFNLDGNEVDAAVYAALCNIPRGKRSGVVKELLHAALCESEAAALRMNKNSISLQRKPERPDHAAVRGNQVSRHLPFSDSPTPIRMAHSEQMEKEKDGAPAAAADKDARMNRGQKELDEFRSLIY